MKRFLLLTGLVTIVAAVCFGQANRTPLNRAFLQSNADGNGLRWTNVGGVIYTDGSLQTSGYAPEFDRTNWILRTTTDNLTNALVQIGNGSVSMPLWNYNGVGNPNTFNQLNGMINWYASGWNGLTTGPTNTGLSGYTGQLCSIRGIWKWGGVDTPAFPTLHIESQGAIRIEPTYGFSGSSNVTGYLSLGNEDMSHEMFVNYNTRSFTNPHANDKGYSIPLMFIAKGTDSGGQVYIVRPGIQGYVNGTNQYQVSGSYGGYHLGELVFYRRAPSPDLTVGTFGQLDPTFTSEGGRMTTDGWRFNGPVTNMNYVSSYGGYYFPTGYTSTTFSNQNLASFLVVSNNYLYFVTKTKTNLVLNGN